MKRYYGNRQFKENPLHIDYTDNVEYIKLKAGTSDFRVDGIGFSRGISGVQPLAIRITDDLTEIVTLPAYKYDEVQKLLEDEDFISDVRAGKVNIETYEYVAHIKDNGKEFDKKCVGYNFCVEDEENEEWLNACEIIHYKWWF